MTTRILHATPVAGMVAPDIEHTLNLSASRAHDSALEVLGAYKLSGNFHVNLEIVLKDIDAFDKVTFEVQPGSRLRYSPDCRHVLFRPNEYIRMSEFSKIMSSINGRIGFGATYSWAARAFHWLLAQLEPANMIPVLGARTGFSRELGSALRKPSTIGVRSSIP